MARSVTIAAGKTNVELPDGGHYDAGTTVTLTDAQFNQIPSSAIPGTVIDNGFVAGGDAVTTQGGHIAAVGALTAVNAVGSTPTAAEYNAVVADLATLRTALNAALAALEGTGKALS